MRRRHSDAHEERSWLDQRGAEVDGGAQSVAAEAEETSDPVEIIQRGAHGGLTIATAESLTAGSLAARLADVPGASAVLLGGVVAYCNEVKHHLLAVDAELLESRGAVDPAVAAAMARGAAAATGADIGIATTGVAGPAPHEGKDVGTVYLGLACSDEAVQRLGLRLPDDCVEDLEYASDGEGAPWSAGSLLLNLDGDRAGIREASVEGALKLIDDFLHTEPSGIGEPR